MTGRRMHMANSFDPTRSAGLGEEERRLVERRSRAMGAAYRLFYERPVHLVSGEGVILRDAQGQDYLDAYNNVPVVGHANERVRHAVDAQLRTLNTHTRYLGEEVVAYAERLTALFPYPLTQAIFTCTGSEAADLALRVARTVTGRTGVVVTSHAYHGTTTAAAEVSPSLGPHNPLPPEVAVVDAPDMVRDDPATAVDAFARRVDEAVAELESRGVRLAAVLLDSVMSSDGLQPLPLGLLEAAAGRARAHGGLYVADEVQAGFGRTGAQWWGFERHGVVPDLVVLGKPMGNGLPLAGVVGSAQVLDAFGHQVRYFNTFGGSPVSIAAGSAVLDEIEGRGLLQHSEDLGRELLEGLRSVAERHDGVAQVRGAGLFAAVELVGPDGAPDPARAAAVVNALRERRILISASGRHGEVLKIRPPLVFPSSQLPRLLDGVDAALAEAVVGR